MTLLARHLAFGYVPGAAVLRSVSLALGPGQVLFVLGPNGSGKTTLLECLAGLHPLWHGTVTVDGQDIARLTPRARAAQIGLVPQLHEPVFGFTVGQCVMMGRTPHLGLFGRPGRRDIAAVTDAMEAVGIESLADRPYTKISGGERQLALIARGLAQGARRLLMDEPAAHLDPHHQHEVLSAARRLTHEGFSFVVSSHVPNHALLYADWTVFLVQGRADTQGHPARLLTEETLRAAYGMEFDVIEGSSGARAVLPRMS